MRVFEIFQALRRQFESAPAPSPEGSATASPQEELRIRNLQFDLAINNMVQGLCFFDKAQRLIVSNDRYVEMYRLDPARVVPGVTLREIVDLRFSAGTFPDMSAEDYLKWRDTINVSDKPSDTMVKLKDGRTFQIRHRPMAGGGWVATHEDITEREAARETAQRVLAALESQNRVLHERETQIEEANRHFDIALSNMAQGLCLFDADLRVLANLAGIDLIVVPKVEAPEYAEVLAGRLGKPLLAMIETPAGIYAAREIAGAPGVVGLLAGSNDLAATLRLPSGRAGLTLALQSIILAARAAGVVALDGVFNALDDENGLETDCMAGRQIGFDGKGLIHPNQIDIANRVFGPTSQEIEDAQALIAAATGGAERFRGRMIEAMHVQAARRALRRAGVA